jgi:hypothetical protein
VEVEAIEIEHTPDCVDYLLRLQFVGSLQVLVGSYPRRHPLLDIEYTVGGLPLLSFLL